MSDLSLRVGDPVPSETFEQVLLDSERLRSERNDWMQEAAQLKARVDLLTAALAEIVAYWDDENAWAEEGDEIRIRVRAALSATRTEEKA